MPRTLTCWIFALALGACADWPLWRHIEPLEETVPAGTDPATVVAEDYDWQPIRGEGEPNDLPGEPLSIGRWEGLTITGDLQDGGWDPERPVERGGTATCADPLFFPLPADPNDPAASSLGDYTGDIDWISLEPLRDGQLCVRIEFEGAPVDFDLLLLDRDPCGRPVGLQGEIPYPYPTAVPGYGISDHGALYQARVRALEPLALGLAAWSELDAPSPWRLTLALGEAPDDGGDIVCPAAQTGDAP